MIWGVVGGGWMSGLTYEADDRYRAQLELLASNDLEVTGWSARRLMRMEPGRREQLAGWLREFDARATLGVGFDYLSEDPDEVRRGTDFVLEALEELADDMRAPACTTGLGRCHRFMREPSLKEQLDRFSEVLAPLAEAAYRAGCPLGIHNTGHYGCDLAELCERTPHLGVFFDTANPFLVGERPIRAAEAMAPYVVGTHFKDSHVAPGFSPLRLTIRGAVPGRGDAELEEVYRVLAENAPDPDGLAMVFEIDPVEGKTREEALAEALNFARSLDPDFGRGESPS